MTLLRKLIQIIKSIKIFLYQIEKAFQKQPNIFQNAKPTGKKVKNKKLRWYKDVGLGFKTPKEAIEGHYIDKKCPWTGMVSIRGRILSGVVVSTKMKRTVIVRREYLHYITKYNRYEKRHKNFAAHLSPAVIGVQVLIQAIKRFFNYENYLY